jgi:hypothetical protein
MMKKDIPIFQQYQQAFTAYIRDPLNQPRPINVVPRGMDVYKEIVFNNFFESVSACFPVARKVIGKRVWLKLVRGFFREHSSSTPTYFYICVWGFAALFNKPLSLRMG